MAKSLKLHARTSPELVQEAIEQFLAVSRKPMLIEHGEPAFALEEGRYSFAVSGAAFVISVWDDERQLSRRIAAVVSIQPGRLTLAIVRFGGRTGVIELLDAARPQNSSAVKKGERTVFRDVFGQMLRKNFPGWKLMGLSSEKDLEHTLSGSHPRAWLRKGAGAWAAIASTTEGARPEDALTYGLIWLAYLRQRDPKTRFSGLVLFVPHAGVRATALRLRWLEGAKFVLFAYSGGSAQVVDISDAGNLDTSIKAAHDTGGDTPEKLLELQVRRSISELDAHLLPEPVYGQVPSMAGVDRGIADLLAIDRFRRLAVIEIKASEDPHLPLQALDYWMRVAWHASRGDFNRAGYFPGMEVSTEPPRLMLLAPALDFHSTTETILQFFPSTIAVERFGVGVEWRQRLRILFRWHGSRPASRPG